ncbi:SUKH-3 domain-containing protein [Lignipirellula cremea]|uniref:SUKH-3 immunity protein n=1 Tax=Lignipirellula cremea TaxID=2528010 RepID=A0A518DWV9_9BACT|nr:SUKH-3 domain-containing protein [Lignipirellula cremea]QDU96317.1 hypothetical protein Pla8534_41370 [Lignipirellula cremea]
MSEKNKLGTFSVRAIETLSLQGWETGRHVSIEAYQDELTTHGFLLNDVARQILESFAGCSFAVPEGGIAWIVFNITQARHTFKPTHVPVLEVLLEEEGPCPAGGGAGHILFACPSGKVALLQEQWFSLLAADSFADLLEAILFKDLRHCHEVPNVEECCPDW